jgi:hypothetical protein
MGSSIKVNAEMGDGGGSSHQYQSISSASSILVLSSFGFVGSD